METKALSMMLGHSNVAITLNRYVHPSMEVRIKEMVKLTKLFPINIVEKNE